MVNAIRLPFRKGGGDVVVQGARACQVPTERLFHYYTRKPPGLVGKPSLMKAPDDDLIEEPGGVGK